MLKNKFYYFSGKDEEYQNINGTIYASSKSIAHYLLLKIGLKKINYLIINFSSIKKMFYLSLKEKHLFFSNLSHLFNSGISIIDSIQTMKLDANTFKLKYITHLILNNLHEGYQFSVSLEKLPFNSFSKAETRLINTAEMSGTLDATLKFICNMLANKIHIRQKIISSSIYPIITLLISFIITFLVFKFVIPQFQVMFTQNNQPLPWMTTFVFSISKHIGFYTCFMLCILMIAFFILKFLIKCKLISEKMAETFVLKIPVVGKILTMNNRINFCYALSTLLGAGVPIHNAILETTKHVSLSYSKHRLKLAINALLSGKSLSKSLRKTHFFHRSSIQTISVAESTGRLDEAFARIGQQTTNELSVFSDHIGKAIEPFIIILLGSIIALIVIAIYLPIFQLGNLY